MRYLKKFNEAIIDYKTENLDNFYKEVNEELNIGRGLSFQKLVLMGDKNDIEIVHYRTFLNELPDDQKNTAPPSNAPFFALVNPVTKKSRIVLNDRISMIDTFMFKELFHMLKHENIHIGQQSRRIDSGSKLPNPNNRKEYFSDPDEVMAFSQSIVDKIMDESPKNMKDAISYLKRNRLYNDIKFNVDEKTLKKYHKYIFLYLENEGISNDSGVNGDEFFNK